MAARPIQTTEVKGPFAGPRADLGRPPRAADAVIIGAAVVTGLYFGREVLIPIALAVLLSFVLAPAVIALTRIRLGKVFSVLVVVIAMVALLIGLGTVIGRQISQLAQNLPQYQSVIGQKLTSVQRSEIGRGVVEKAADVLQGLNSKLAKSPAPSRSPSVEAPTGPAEPTLLPVEVHEPAPGPIQLLQSIVSALLPPLTMVAIVIIFVIFILLQREDLRDRFIGLIGAHDLHRTTTALDDAAFRLSRYFLALTGINAAFGVLIAAGLMFIGVPNPILWGIFGAVLRFIPFAGAFIAAAFPLALGAAVDPGWSMAVETALLFIVLEMIMGQVVEPKLFGHTTGLSPLAIMVAAAFWTLIWGPVGLLLSTPVTACLVVIGRHVENLNFFELLLGDKPALSPSQSFYQRILASDPDEVAYQAEILLKDMTLLQYYEDVALPALALAQFDVARGVLAHDRQVEVRSSVERVTDDLSDHVDQPLDGDAAAADELVEAPVDGTEPAPLRFKSLLCVGGRTPLDEAACAILCQMLNRQGISTTVAGADVITRAGVSELAGDAVDGVFLVYLDHQSVAPIRFAVRRLKRRFANLPVAVCLWGGVEPSAKADDPGADTTLRTLREAIDFCLSTEPPNPTVESLNSRRQIELVADGPKAREAVAGLQGGSSGAYVAPKASPSIR